MPRARARQPNLPAAVAERHFAAILDCARRHFAGPTVPATTEAIG